MSTHIIPVFVSSTWLDLQPERAAVEGVLNRMEETKFVGMEYFGSRDETTEQASLDDVDKCQLYIGILGPRYGSGITEKEYQRALENEIPCLWYVIEGDSLNGFGIDDAKNRDALLGSFSQNHLRNSFTSSEDLAVKVTADLHSWLTKQDLPQKGHKELLKSYVSGVRSLPYDYAGRIENFLNEYLGTPDHPVAFGGRDAELDALDAWLDDEEESPYLILAAPAGRGKSALLVHWSRQVQKREDVEVVFVPVSIRFRTNLSGVFFAALAARLGKLHGDEIKETSTHTAEMWRGLITDYLRKPLPESKRLLLIADGLDEAADWEAGMDLFPNQPPDRLKIVVSARYQTGDVDASEWLGRLGWERKDLGKTLELELLSETGLRGVLESMGFPIAQLSERVDVIKEIYRLSKGDPLLVQLYTQDLWKKDGEAVHQRPADLQSIEPGLDGYFDRWWKEQRKLWKEQEEKPLREKAVVALLDLFAFALGPLLQDDIISLIGEEYELDNSFALEEALIPLSRFVIGDGLDHGFVFSHPKLGYYFQDKKGSVEKRQWEERFKAWGRDVIESLHAGDVDHKEVSGYLIQYYGSHLERADAEINERMLLVHRKWCDAWEAFEGTNAGFLNDVARVKEKGRELSEQHIAHGKPSPYLGKEILCFLVEASIRSLTSNMPDQLPVLLFTSGLWTENQVLTFIDQVFDSNKKVQILLSVSRHIDTEWMPRVFELVQTLESESDRVLALSGIAPHLTRQQKTQTLTEAMEAAKAIQDEYHRALALTSIYPQLSGQQITEALEEAKTIQDESGRARALSGIAKQLTGQQKTQTLTEALEAAKAIQYEPSQTFALTSIAPQLTGQQITEALLAVKAMHNETSQSWVLTGIAPQLTGQQITEALEVAKAFRDEICRVSALTSIAPQLTGKHKTQALTEALEAAKAIRDESSRALALKGIAALLTGQQKKQTLIEALEAAKAIRDEGSRARVLTSIAPQLTGQQITEALETAKSFRDEPDRALALTGIAPQLTGQQITEALEATKAFQDEPSRASALTGIAALLTGQQKKQTLTEALEAAKAIRDESSRVMALTSIAPQLRGKQIAEALEAAKAFQNESNQTTVLTSIAPQLAGQQITEALEAAKAFQDETSRASALTSIAAQLTGQQITEALEVAKAFQDEFNRIKALTGIAAQLTGQQKTQTLTEAMEAAKAIRDESSRVRALTSIAALLTGQQKTQILTEALEAVKAMHYEPSRVRALTSIAVLLTGEQKTQTLTEALEAVKAMHYEPSRARILTGIAPQLKGQQITEALEAVKAFQEEPSRASALTGIAPQLRGKQITEALEAAKAFQDEYYRASALTSIAAQLTGQQITKALEVAKAIQDETSRAWALTSIAAQLNGQQKMQILTEALEAVKTIQNEPNRASALTSIAPQLRGQQITEALEAAKSIRGGSSQALALTGIAPQLRGKQITNTLREAFELVKKIKASTSNDPKLNVLQSFPIQIDMITSEPLRDTLDDMLVERDVILNRVGELVKFIKTLGGEESMTDVVRGIRQVAAWWP